jgi:dTDP-glucose 4,6-dehydratase
MRVMITGGAGFIGSAFCRQAAGVWGWDVLNLDKLTYAGNPASLAPIDASPAYQFVEGDIGDAALVDQVLSTYKPQAILNFAAESHVDRSISGPEAFVQTNVMGTVVLLGAATRYFERLSEADRAAFRFLHVSTDEVYGSLGAEGAFSETTPYDPRSPYSASKAASDHFVRAWWHTYGLPTLVTNCSNNYGPYHFPEKLIPLTILKALAGEALPVYGAGQNIRDWLHVEDHVEALRLVVERGAIGETYNVGGRNERTNLEVVHAICDHLDEIAPTNAGPRRGLIQFVTDRPGHDLRYAIDPTRLEGELGWRPKYNFDTGLPHTIAWYLANEAWWRPILDQKYAGERLGLKG